MKTLTIRADKVYGQVKLYPACPDSELFAQLTGTKTFSTHNLRAMAALGYKFHMIGFTAGLGAEISNLPICAC